MKRLQASLSEAEQSLSDLQSDREYEVRQAGYDGLSEDLDQALEDSLNSVKYNADEQERVISEMLSRVVSNYQDAYGKINQIIANTGLVPSDQFQQVIDNIGTQQGAQNQVNWSNTIAPEYNPNDYSSGINTSPIQSGSSQANNDKIQAEIEKEPNTTNRPVAQITLSPSSVSVREGSSATVKATVRPTDAANKSVEWKSSNTAVATVSNGVIKGVKPGSTQITCASTDGSGVSASVGVTVTAKPKPVAPSTSTGGDGTPRVGDTATLSGWYYYDSWGSSPAGNRYSGVKNGVIIDAYSASKYGGSARYTGGYDVHIKSADGVYGDLGWVKLSQLSGYATGTTEITSSTEIAKIDEVGKELRIKYGGDAYDILHYGDGVVPKNLTDNLFTLANHKGDIMKTINSVDRGGDITVNNNYESLVHVEGNIDKDVWPGMKKTLEQSYEYTSQRLYKEAGLQGIRKSL